MAIPLGYGQINHRFSGFGAPFGAEVTLGFDLGGYTGTPAELAELAHVAWGDSVMADLSADYVLASTMVKYGPDSTGPSGEFADPIPGASPNTGASSQVAYLVRKNTDLGGRSGRGRWFIPGVQESEVAADGSITSGIVTALQGDIDAYIADLGTSGPEPVVLHSAGAPVTTPTPITSFSVQGRVATQRRRLRR